MPLTRNIEDPRVVKQLDGLNHRNQFIRELASAILPGNDGFESVLSIANRVYERHSLPEDRSAPDRSIQDRSQNYCSPQSGFMNRRRPDRPQITALSA